MTFHHVRPGDTVTRMLAGAIRMDLIVADVTPDRILCQGGWEFDRNTGREIDDCIDIPVSHLVEQP